jgi:hypothetical protein
VGELLKTERFSRSDPELVEGERRNCVQEDDGAQGSEDCREVGEIGI